jgi:DNA-binding transcriptional MerR regulator
LKIGQLSKATGISTRSIRHYEKKNLIKASRLDNDYREFEKTSIERIKLIQMYLGLGMSTDEISEIFQGHNEVSYDDRDEFCVEMLEAYEEKRDRVVKQIQALTTIQNRLEQQIKHMNQQRDLMEIPHN